MAAPGSLSRVPGNLSVEDDEILHQTLISVFISVRGELNKLQDLTFRSIISEILVFTQVCGTKECHKAQVWVKVSQKLFSSSWEHFCGGKKKKKKKKKKKLSYYFYQ